MRKAALQMLEDVSKKITREVRSDEGKPELEELEEDSLEAQMLREIGKSQGEN